MHGSRSLRHSGGLLLSSIDARLLASPDIINNAACALADGLQLLTRSLGNMPEAQGFVLAERDLYDRAAIIHCRPEHDGRAIILRLAMSCLVTEYSAVPDVPDLVLPLNKAEFCNL